jgi:hypothetical protein
MPRSPAGPGRPFCTSDRETPDAKHVKIDARESDFPAIARAASGAAKGAPENSAAASSSNWPRRPAAPARRDWETRRVTLVAPLSGSDAGETRPTFEVDEPNGPLGKTRREQIAASHNKRGAAKRRSAHPRGDLSMPRVRGGLPRFGTRFSRFQTLQRRLRQRAVTTARPSLRAHYPLQSPPCATRLVKVRADKSRDHHARKPLVGCDPAKAVKKETAKRRNRRDYQAERGGARACCAIWRKLAFGD